MLLFHSIAESKADAAHKANPPSKEESRENRTDHYTGRKPHKYKVKVKGQVKEVTGWL